jgi:hypothetical protein
LTLAFEHPLDDPLSKKNMILKNIGMVLAFVFLIEAVLKIIVNGFIFNGRHSYLRGGWNQLDFVIVICSILSFALDSNKLKSVKVIRILRVLRPLRMISGNEGLQLCVKSLLLSLPGIINVIILTLFFFLIFGILFTNFFKGKYYQCS